MCITTATVLGTQSEGWEGTHAGHVRVFYEVKREALRPEGLRLFGVLEDGSPPKLASHHACPGGDGSK